MTVKEKIKEYLDYKGISPTSVERELNWGVGAFTKPKSITADRAKELLLLYTDLSSEWLFREIGEMIRPAIDKNTTSPINVDGELTNTEMEKEIKRLRASIDALIEKNERLEAELAMYQEKESPSKEFAG